MVLECVALPVRIVDNAGRALRSRCLLLPELMSWLGAIVPPRGSFRRRLKAGALICADTEPLSNLSRVLLFISCHAIAHI